MIALGQSTNLASALLIDPTIKDEVVFAFINGDFTTCASGTAGLESLAVASGGSFNAGSLTVTADSEPPRQAGLTGLTATQRGKSCNIDEALTVY